jgi:hypothetical protein
MAYTSRAAVARRRRAKVGDVRKNRPEMMERVGLL